MSTADLFGDDPARPWYLVTQRQLAEFFGVSTSGVQKWPLDSTKAGRCRLYDLRDAVAFRFATETRERLTLEQERARLTRLQADQLQARISVEAGELIPASEIEKTWSVIMSAHHAQIRSVLGEINALIGRKSIEKDVGEAVKEKISNALEQLADFDPVAGEVTPGRAAIAVGRKDKATNKRGKVPGRKPRPKPRRKRKAG